MKKLSRLMQDQRFGWGKFKKFWNFQTLTLREHVGQDGEGLPVSLHGEDGDGPTEKGEFTSNNHFQSRFKSQKVWAGSSYPKSSIFLYPNFRGPPKNLSSKITWSPKILHATRISKFALSLENKSSKDLKILINPHAVGMDW